MKNIKYVHVQGGEIVDRKVRAPKWYDENGDQITDDATFLAGGWYPVQDSGASYDPERQKATPNDYTQWAIQSDHVAVTYTVTHKTLDEVKNDRVASAERFYTDHLSGGFAYDFGTKTATLPDGTTEPAGVRTLQTRPADRERWQATMQVAQQYVMAGVPTEPMRPFRTEDNASIPMTAQDVVDCLNAMQAFFGQALDALWAHKDAVRSLTTVDDVVAYDHTTGWE